MQATAAHRSVSFLACVFASCVMLGPLTAHAEADSLTSPPKRLGRSLRLLDQPIEVPQYAFAERGANGESRDRAINDYRGKVVVLNFWATWCGVCKREMPRLDALVARLDPARIEVVAISIDEDPRVLDGVLDERGLARLRLYHDAQSALYPLMGARGVPTTFVVDPMGHAVAKAQGPTDWDSPEAAAWLDSLLPSGSVPVVPLAPLVPSGAADADDQSSPRT